MHILVLLKFTPLEFETLYKNQTLQTLTALKFTPLEFETTKTTNGAEISKTC